MMMMRSAATALTAMALLVSAVVAFSFSPQHPYRHCLPSQPPPPQQHQQQQQPPKVDLLAQRHPWVLHQHVSSSENDNNDDDDDVGLTTRSRFLHNLIVGVVGAATTVTSTTVLSHPAFAVAIKELDFSLPSYDDVKAPTVSVENVESLSVKPVKKESTGMPSSSASQKASLAANEGSGSPLNLILPSTGKMSAEEKAKKKKGSTPEYDF